MMNYEQLYTEIKINHDAVCADLNNLRQENAQLKKDINFYQDRMGELKYLQGFEEAVRTIFGKD